MDAKNTKKMAAGKEPVKFVLTGTFPAQQFFDALAAILSHRENVIITAKVTKKGEQRKKEAV